MQGEFQQSLEYCKNNSKLVVHGVNEIEFEYDASRFHYMPSERNDA